MEEWWPVIGSLVGAGWGLTGVVMWWRGYWHGYRMARRNYDPTYHE